jgi:hypothetical protein
MIFGHDFKYQIPEMDRLLGAAADMGIHFPYEQETVSYPDGKKYLLQTVMGDFDGTCITFSITKYNAAKREETK